MLRFSLTLALFILFSAITANAQSSAFTYQGKLTDNNAAANGTYEMQFTLFDADSGGSQIGTTFTVNNVSVSNGIFTTRITFGNPAFDGNPRFMEIAVRPAGNQNPFTTLAPRQSVLSSPYSIRSLTAATADLALNSNQLGGIAASQYVLTNDTRMSDARDPLPGSGNYIQNTTSAQLLSNFNISGEGKANVFSAATQFNIGANRVLAANSTRSVFAGIGAGQSNTTSDGNAFFGKDSGFANTTGSYNSFFGLESGLANTTGGVNSFFGSGAGRANTTGMNNAFYGGDSGRLNTTGEDNSFFGTFSGRNNTIGEDNSFFGILSGNFNTSGTGNSFFGAAAGYNNTSGNSNVFFGRDSGGSNTTGATNTFIGINSGFANTTGSNNTLLGGNTNLGANNLTFASAIGAGATVSANNTLVLGRSTDTVQVPGSLNIAGSFGANILNATTQYNLNGNRVLSIPGTNNLFAGIGAGTSNTGSGNAFFGSLAGESNTSGINNAFFGFNAGSANNGGGANTFIGVNAGLANVGSSNNTFLGANAGNTNLTGSGNTYLGANSDGGFLITNSVAIGQKAYVGQSNALVLGSINNVNGATVDTDVGIGTSTPLARFHVVGNSALVGSVGIGTTTPQAKLSVLDNGSTNVNLIVESSSTTGAGILLNNTQQNGQRWLIYSDNTQNGVFGSLHFLNQNTGRAVLGINAVGLGNSGQVEVNGDLITTGFVILYTYASAGSTSLCKNAVGALALCSSSIRYKKDIKPFTSGLSLLNQLKPVTYRWKADDMPDLGFVAEEVAEIEPLLTTTNDKGEIEGVKYDRISAVLVNAVKEQQAQIKDQQEQIKQQQTQIDVLKKLVCASNKEADVCKEKQ